MQGVAIIQKQAVVTVPATIVTVQNVQRTADVCQLSASSVSVLRQEKSVSVSRSEAITVQAKRPIVYVTTLQSFSALKSRPFYFEATEGQTEFELPTTPQPGGIIMLARNGVWQSQAKGDFSVEGKIITTDTAQDAGDEIAGIYEEP